ncbi:hypothetical protein HMSSN036_78110 [Paenibacillus macerans]|nr:hypothetical protein HMSSN036_78110 [Paenibacillus macerans]
MENELCDLHDIIMELTPLLWADANLRGQTIEVKLDEQVPALLLNGKEIKQLILNLARNAMEAMEGKGQLTMETRLADSGVELLVTDTGPGIPPSQQAKLFEPFYTTKEKGTGIGLALCLSIIERHRGKISVRSGEGEGTTFTVFFRSPRRKAPSEEPLRKKLGAVRNGPVNAGFNLAPFVFAFQLDECIIDIIRQPGAIVTAGCGATYFVCTRSDLNVYVI